MQVSGVNLSRQRIGAGCEGLVKGRDATAACGGVPTGQGEATPRSPTANRPRWHPRMKRGAALSGKREGRRRAVPAPLFRSLRRCGPLFNQRPLAKAVNLLFWAARRTVCREIGGGKHL